MKANMRTTGIAMLVMGLICAALAAWFIISDYRQIAAARSWTSTQAVVVGSWVDVDRGSGRNRRTRYIPKVNYSYTVAGRTFYNDYIWLTSTQSYTGRANAETFLRAYPRGGTVPVFYDPADPQRSALLIESGAAPLYALLAVGVVLIGIGIWLLRRKA